MKYIAFHLPAYHQIPENDRWYGEGFTEWDNTRKGIQLYKNHYQPRIPLNHNYYDLSKDNDILEQSRIASEYGVDAFCFYHYWFAGKRILEKPVERYFELKEAATEYCFCWANEPWRNTWHDGSGKEEMLIDQEYGDVKDWEEHFNYLLPFFKDVRYLKVDNKPMFLIYRLGSIECADEMFSLWNKLAIDNGFSGLYLVQMHTQDIEVTNSNVNAHLNFEPNKTFSSSESDIKLKPWRIKLFLQRKLINTKLFRPLINCTIDYDSFYKTLIQKDVPNSSYYYCLFNDWDNTPRKGKRGIIFKNVTPNKFKKYLDIFTKKSIEKSNSYIFLFAWNEWGEGGYLEPDEKYEYQYLKAIKEVKNKYDK